MATKKNGSFCRVFGCSVWMRTEQCQYGVRAQVRKAFQSLSLLLLVLAGSIKLIAQPTASTPVYLDAKQPISARVDDLMRRMTLKEKIGQLNLPCAYVDALGKTVPEKMAAARKFAAGTYTTEIGPGAGFFTLADTIKLNDLPQQVEYL